MTVFTTTQTNVGIHDGVGQHFTGSHDTTTVHHSSSASSVTSTTTYVNSTIHLPQGVLYKNKLSMYSSISNHISTILCAKMCTLSLKCSISIGFALNRQEFLLLCPQKLTFSYVRDCMVTLNHAEKNSIRHQLSPPDVYYQSLSRYYTSINGDFCLFWVATVYISKLDFIEFQ